MRAPTRPSRSSHSGQTLIEFALASSLLFLTIFGIISGGLSVYRYNMVANLAQEGARWGAVRGATSTATFKAEGTRAQMEAHLHARNAGVPFTVSVNADPNTLAPGTTLHVTVTTTWLPLTPYVPLSAFQMSATAGQVVAR